MEFGAHLPLIDFSGEGYSLAKLSSFAETADRLGFTFLCANDHLVFPRPWLDGPTALAAVAERSGTMTLATTVSLPIVRGPAALAKTLAAIDILSGGRLVVGVGPGSSPRDYEAIDLPFQERWKRLDEAVPALRAHWSREGEEFCGRFYSTRGMSLEPYPIQEVGPPIWIGSWGSPAGLRRVARLADGWLASGYNTTPEQFRESRQALGEELRIRGKDPEGFPNGIATMWLFVSEDRAETDGVLQNILSPAIKRPVDELRARLPIGPAAACAEKLSAYAAAGAHRVFVWPLKDELKQLQILAERVAPLVTP